MTGETTGLKIREGVGWPVGRRPFVAWLVAVVAAHVVHAATGSGVQAVAVYFTLFAVVFGVQLHWAAAGGTVVDLGPTLIAVFAVVAVGQLALGLGRLATTDQPHHSWATIVLLRPLMVGALLTLTASVAAWVALRD